MDSSNESIRSLESYTQYLQLSLKYAASGYILNCLFICLYEQDKRIHSFIGVVMWESVQLGNHLKEFWHMSSIEQEQRMM
jgi:hypothetical protein